MSRVTGKRRYSYRALFRIGEHFLGAHNEASANLSKVLVSQNAEHIFDNCYK
jgi:hypothetical protein